jgi:hypothetical protein
MHSTASLLKRTNNLLTWNIVFRRPIVAAFLMCSFATVFSPLESVAQSLEVPETGPSNVCNLDFYTPRRPNLGNGPTEVGVGVTVVDLLEIDDANQSVGIDLYIIMRWQDPALERLAGCRLAFNSIWGPELELINSGTIQRRQEPLIEVETGGHIRAAVRIQGNLSSPHNLRDFPMDERTIRLNIFSPRNGIEEVVLKSDETWTRRADELTIGNWEVGQVKAVVAPFEVAQLGQTFSRYTLELPTKRYAGYYFYKVLLPLGMITLMAFGVFWIDPRQFAAQLSMAATAVLTLIAFQFSLTELLPAISYLTRMDQFVLGANIAVFLALMESVLIGFLVTKDRQASAIRIDTACRWIFPISFAVFTLIVFL